MIVRSFFRPSIHRPNTENNDETVKFKKKIYMNRPTHTRDDDFPNILPKAIKMNPLEGQRVIFKKYYVEKINITQKQF